MDSTRKCNRRLDAEEHLIQRFHAKTFPRAIAQLVHEARRSRTVNAEKSSNASSVVGSNCSSGLVISLLIVHNPVRVQWAEGPDVALHCAGNIFLSREANM